MILHTMKFLSFLFLCGPLFAQMPLSLDSPEAKIGVQNAILTKVNGKTISVVDIKKKMDMVFYQNYPQFADSQSTRLQFYNISWRRVLMDMIDNELILADAADKEIKITEGEVREELERQFGPNVMQNLDKAGLTYEDTWQMIKDELTVQKMTGWFIHSKAIANVTPENIRKAYRAYLDEHPSYTAWTYQVISIQTDQPSQELSLQVYRLLSESRHRPEELVTALKELERPGVRISVSKEFTAQTQDLSETHREILSSLLPGSYSKPSLQTSRVGKKTIYRIFYLGAKSEHLAPSFEELSKNLQDELRHKAVAEESQNYLNKLRKYYGFEANQIFPEDFHPFSLQ